MKTGDIDIDDFLVRPGKTISLGDFDPGWRGTADLRALSEKKLKRRAKDFLEDRIKELVDAQELLYADDRYSVLLIFQGMDAAGKDGTIKHVMSGINPQGCQVFSFKVPTKEEIDHNFLWRYWKCLPERGRIGIFNRSYYEDVLVVRVHPEIVPTDRLPPGKVNKAFWQARYKDINAFEQHMTRNGCLIIKFFLNVSKEEQRQRFLDRLRDPAKHWKFSASDLAERQFWDDYQAAFENALNATSTKWAPWYVIPADHKWVMRAIVGHIVVKRMLALGLKFPTLDDEAMAKIVSARQVLEAE